jgi:DNA mismatch repair protein MutS2
MGAVSEAAPPERGDSAAIAPGLDLDLVRALFERLAATSLGARSVRELAPRGDSEARAALARVDEAVRLARARDSYSLAGVCDLAPIRRALLEFHRPLEKSELASVHAFLEACRRLSEWFLDRKDDVPALAALSVGFPGLGALRAALASAVDHRGELKDGASPRLERLRRELRDLDQRVHDAVARLAASPAWRGLLVDSRVHRRGGRRVLAVKAKSAARLAGIVHERSHSGETAFLEPREAVEPQNRLADLERDVRAEEARILVELTRVFLDAWDALSEASERIAEWELAQIGAAFCQRYGARVPATPEWGRDADLLLRGARHPLLVEERERGRLAEVVPIDVRLGREFDLLVVTGPNTGGKTLALKTVGVAAWSVRHGFPVCCGEGSRVPLYEALVADIGDEQEISQSLSTFASHVQRIRAGLARAGPRTLYLLDELGGGTDPDEGAALGDALLEHLLAARAPTLATTHLGKLKEFCFRHARAENASVEFDVETLRPRYRLLIGTPGESNALTIAERLGLAASVVARARERLERRDREAVELMQKMRGAAEHAERARSEAESHLVELKDQGEKLRERERALEAERGRLEAEAQQGLEERVREARRAIESAEPWLAQVPAAGARALREAFDSARAALEGASLTERRRDFLARLKKGAMVWVPRYERRCVVRKVDRARRAVTVRFGNADLVVWFDELSSHEAR